MQVQLESFLYNHIYFNKRGQKSIQARWVFDKPVPILYSFWRYWWVHNCCSILCWNWWTLLLAHRYVFEHRYSHSITVLDDDFYLIEEKKEAEIIDTGKVFRFTSYDSGWCTKCYVYLILDVVDIGRYYITATARARNPQLVMTKTYTAVANIR